MVGCRSVHTVTWLRPRTSQVYWFLGTCAGSSTGSELFHLICVHHDVIDNFHWWHDVWCSWRRWELMVISQRADIYHTYRRHSNGINNNINLIHIIYLQNNKNFPSVFIQCLKIVRISVWAICQSPLFYLFTKNGVSN